MQLILNTFGTSLKVKDGNFLVRAADRKMELAPRKISSILITTGVYLSSDVIQLALQWNIDLVFLDRFGNPYGRVWHCRLGSTTTIRRRQLEIADGREGLHLAKTWIEKKIQNQIDHLKKLRKRRTRKSSTLTKGIDRLSAHYKSLSDLRGKDIESVRGSIMGIEGSGGRIYFQTLSAILPEKYRFNGRSRNPAKDFFNCLLNYSYGVLYSMVERACIIAGLDPYTGLLHTDNYNKKSLVFDFIEPYRVWADRIIMLLISGRKVKQNHFNKIKGGYTLNKEGKALLLGKFNSHLDESIRYRGRNIKRRNIIQFDCHRLANQLIKKNSRAPEEVEF
ncbi:MAG: CRISPR-associated endonuclease Cas1 [Thermodesulfobacteriota bacterium]|nr:CRISPR-associated endonuclease Cas1 [Thermodesulfobacteriota bacterium]